MPGRSDIPELDAGASAGRLAAIGGVLRDFRSLWQGQAFREPELCWEADLPDLSRRLRSLGGAEAEALHAEPLAARALLGAWIPVEA
ncbi:MAG: hypothetical protein ACKO4A_00885, partial [Gammaproteobacteria bacterium]